MVTVGDARMVPSLLLMGWADPMGSHHARVRTRVSEGTLTRMTVSCDWTAAHEQWITAWQFGEPALAAALAHYRTALDTRRAELQAVEDELVARAAVPPLAAAGMIGGRAGLASGGAAEKFAPMRWLRVVSYV